MNVSRGDVVLIDAPFVTRPGSKVRPMLVIQCDQNNRRMQNTIVAMITTNLSRVSEPTQVLVKVATPEGTQAGLLSDSAISTENLLTIRTDHVKKVIGRTAATLMDRVDAALKVSLGLS